MQNDEISQLLKEIKNTKQKNLEARCCICANTGEIPLVTCALCKIVVHLSCYYSVHSFDGDWYCDFCKHVNNHPLQSADLDSLKVSLFSFLFSLLNIDLTKIFFLVHFMFKIWWNNETNRSSWIMVSRNLFHKS